MFKKFSFSDGESEIFRDKDNHIYFVVTPEGNFKELHTLPCVEEGILQKGEFPIMREFVSSVPKKGIFNMKVYAPSDEYFVVEIPVRNFPWRDKETSSLSQMLEILQEISPKTDATYIFRWVMADTVLSNVDFKIKECPTFNSYKGYIHPDTFKIGGENPLYCYSTTVQDAPLYPIPFCGGFFRCNWDEGAWARFFNVHVPRTVGSFLEKYPDVSESTINSYGWAHYVRMEGDGRFHLLPEFKKNVEIFGRHKEFFIIPYEFPER